jgi:hypothetical protein
MFRFGNEECRIGENQHQVGVVDSELEDHHRERDE